MLKDKLFSEYKRAMREKNATLKGAISELRGAVKNAEIANGEVDDQKILNIIKKCVKETHESMEGFEKAGYTEQVEACKARLAIFEEYLPQSASEDQLKSAVSQAVEETGASSMRDMGAVMKRAKELIANLGLDADGKALSVLVKGSLNG